MIIMFRILSSCAETKELSANKLDNIVFGFVLNLADPIEQNRRHSSAMLRIL